MNLAIDRRMWESHVHLKNFQSGRPRTWRPEPDIDHVTSKSRTYRLLWEIEMEKEFLFWVGKQMHSEQQRSQAWSAFRQILEETKRIIVTNGDFKTIAAAFTRFPNLVEISMQTEGRVTEAMASSFKNTLYPPPYQIFPWKMLPPWDQGYQRGTRQYVYPEQMSSFDSAKYIRVIVRLQRRSSLLLSNILLSKQIQM